MRNEWSRSVGVVVAAATLMILTQLPRTGAAADAVPAQGLNGREVAAAAPAPGSGASAVTVDDITVTTATTDDEKPVAVPEVMPPPPTENAMPVDEGAAAPPPDTAPPGEAPPAPARIPTGDDARPTALEQGNNPYIDPARQEVGISNAMGSGMRAYVPPTAVSEKSSRELAGEEGAALLGVLGSDIFNMKVNVTTPPDTESAEVIRLLAERANINFVYGAGVITEKVTLNLRDVSLGVALQSILSAQDLALVREGDNVFRIVRRKDIQQSTVETRTIYIKLNWVTADSLEATLKDFGQSGGTGANVNSVKASKEANTLIITDTPTNVALLRDIVAQLDVPEKQVMIEARMVEMLIDNGRQLGSSLVMERADSSGNSQATGRLNRNGPRTETRLKPTYDADGKITGYEEVTEILDGLPVDQLASTLLNQRAAGALSFGGVVSIFGKEFDIAATLDGLEQRRVANVLANPRVITLNNQEAFIDIQREIPYLEAQQGVSQNAISASVKFKDAGISLAVLPTITNNGYVRMQLKPEQKIESGTFLDVTTGNTIPVIDRRRAQTNVIVKDEDTVVLGGLREITSKEIKAQFPWLGQVPILGQFFKNTEKGHRKNELMIFVTPHIVKAPELTPAEAYKVSRIDAHWDLPDFFFDDSVEARESRHRGELDHNAASYYKDPLTLPALGAAPCPEGKGYAEEFPRPKGE